jgi:hypothetical protein
VVVCTYKAEDCEFEATLGYIERLCLKKKKEKKKLSTKEYQKF